MISRARFSVLPFWQSRLPLSSVDKPIGIALSLGVVDRQERTQKDRSWRTVVLCGIPSGRSASSNRVLYEMSMSFDEYRAQGAEKARLARLVPRPEHVVKHDGIVRQPTSS